MDFYKGLTCNIKGATISHAQGVELWKYDVT